MHGVIEWIPKFICWSPKAHTPSTTVFGGWVFREAIRVKWVDKGGGHFDGISVLKRRGRDTRVLSAMLEYSQKAVICKPGIKLSPELNHAGTLILHFPESRIVKSKCLLFKKNFFFNYFWKDGDTSQNSNGWPVILSMIDYFIIKLLIIQIHKYILLCAFMISRLVKWK